MATHPTEPTSASRHENLPPPHLGLLALEFRAPWEFAALLPAWPALARAPKGDGHSVVVFPGLSAGDPSTAPLRRYLSGLGYEAHGWNQGFNFGARPGVLESCKVQVQSAYEASGKKVSLIGWSLGGIYARELAKMLPDMVRCVISMGTPFSGSPRSTNAWRVYELTSGRKIEREADRYDLPTAPPVPTTSLFSRTDGIVAWRGSIQQKAAHNPNTENVEVLASHIGIGMNPSAWWVVADRLAQDPAQWQPFQRTGLFGLKEWIYPNPDR